LAALAVDEVHKKVCIIERMIQKVVHKTNLHDHNEIRQNLEYWLSRPAEERVAAVEFYRRQVYRDIPRLQRVARVIKRQESGKENPPDIEALE